MPLRLRPTLLSALLALTRPAAAQDTALPREAQIGPRPFYLVDKMKDGPLKTEARANAPGRSTRPISRSATAAPR